MSTKQTSTSGTTLNYSPQALATYNSLIGQMLPVLQGYMQDPLKSSFFLQNAGMADKFAAQQGQTGVTNLMSNMQQSGFGNMPGFQQALLGQAGRATSGLRSNAFTQTLLDAAGKRLQAAGLAEGFQPLLQGTSTTGTTTKSGLGTWLPQLAAAGLGGLFNMGQQQPAPSSGSTSSLGGPLNSYNPQLQGIISGLANTNNGIAASNSSLPSTSGIFNTFPQMTTSPFNPSSMIPGYPSMPGQGGGGAYDLMAGWR